MRGAWRSAAVPLLGVLLLLGVSTEPSVLLAGVIGAGLFSALALVRFLQLAVRPAVAAGPAVAVHEHLRALARRGVPRLRDPDAAGHTRSRAPAGPLPAV